LPLADLEHPRHLALLGPTACGKSALALELARAVPGVEVVSVDSMQVYRGMDIGTAKPTREEQAEVRHHLIDVAEPSERFTVARFRSAAVDALSAIEARGHTAVLVGGTGLYLQAVLGDLDPPGEWPEVRAGLEASPDTGDLYRRLQRLDPVAAGRMEPTNRRRIVRALEVVEGSGRPFSSYGPGIGAYPPLGRFVLAGIWLPRATVAARVAARVEAMVRAGLIDEVRGLAPRLGPTARQALGYKEILSYLHGRATLEEVTGQTIRRTRAFSLRQRRWFRRDPRIAWYATDSNPVALAPALLRELQRCHRSP
jgi:tRNA dimethylallyltransferase